MNKILLRTGGIINALFFVFHIWLGWRIWHWTGVPEGLRSLLEIFNIGGSLFIGYFAYASLCRTAEMLESGLGRSLSVLVILLYGTRAAAEFVFQPKAQPAIVAACLVVTAVYLAVLLLRPRQSVPAA
ncbi:MAG TPA: hypothetical protein VIK52_14565 [Opitutaceae bacterium]